MFFRKKEFKNLDGTLRNYLHLVENKKINSKVVQTSLINFGRIDNGQAAEKVDQMIELLISLSSNYSVLNIEKDIDSKHSLQYGPLAVFNMTLNRLVDPCSKRQMMQFQNETYDISKFELHQYYRERDYLIEEKEDIEKRIFNDYV